MVRSLALRLIQAIAFAIPVLFLNLAQAADELPPLTQDELFDGQKLLDVQIEIGEADWKKLSAQTLSFVTAFGKGPIPDSYDYFPAEITIDGRKLGSVDLRKKGFFGSMDQDRPSLKVRVTGADKTRWIGGLDKLTLNNNKQDRAVVSQFLAYRLFQVAGLPAPRCSLAKVTVNGKSLGIYTHVESVDQPFLRRTFGNDSGNLYEGVFPTDFLAGRLERFELKTNRREEDRSDLRRVTEILENPGEDAAARLAKEIDLDQFITHWALESLIGFWDGYASNQNNYYLYKSPKDSRFHFIPWGADMTMSPPFFPAAGGKSVFAKGQLAFQLNQDPAIRQQYHKTLLKLLDTVWHEEQMIAEVDRIQELVKGQLHPAQNGTEQAAEATRKFLRERRAEILAEIKDGPIHVTKAPAQPFYFRESGKVSATFATEWSPKDAKKPVESNNATLELELNGEPVKFTAVTTTSGPARFAGFGGPPGPLPPTVVLIGVRESDKKKLTLTVNFTPDQFQSAPEDSLVVQGAMVEGEGAIFGPGVKTFQGKVRLKSAGREDGSKVEGSLSGKLYEMRGGFGG